MAARQWVWVVVLCGCGGEVPAQLDPLEPDPPPVTSTPAIPPPIHPEFACFADVQQDDLLDDALDGTRFEGYDAANPTWLLYAANDLNGNGLLDSIELYERDADGNTTRYERERSGPETTETTWDERGNPLVEDYDLGSDGLVDLRSVSTWDPNDRILHFEQDLGANGTIDYSYDYLRDPDGIPISAVQDDDGDGVPERFYLFTYDAFDRVELVTIDEGIDDDIDAVYTYTYTDPELVVGGSTLDADNDGTTDEVTEFAYDDQGLLLYYATDSTPDGAWDSEEFYTYDAEGRALTHAVYTAYYTDRYEWDQTWGYDALGRIVQSTDHFTVNDRDLSNTRTDTTFGGSCP